MATLPNWEKLTKQQQGREARSMVMACYTQQEIADAVGMERDSINKSFGDFGNIAEFGKTAQAAAEHATDFEPPIYNVWKQQSKKGSHQANFIRCRRGVDPLAPAECIPQPLDDDPLRIVRRSARSQ